MPLRKGFSRPGRVVKPAGIDGSAIETCEEKGCGLIMTMTDTLLPGITAGELMTSARKRLPEQTAVIITAHASVAAAQPLQGLRKGRTAKNCFLLCTADDLAINPPKSPPVTIYE